MRLICGIMRLDGAPASEEVLSSMLSALVSPGLTPNISRHTSGSVALGTLDFSRTGPTRLPVTSGGACLAADCRLDRPRELASLLGLPVDTAHEDLLLAALAKWGEDVPDRVDGDFALAAWDPRDRTLICARDFLGVRPLCYSYQPARYFAFASLPRGLHGSGVASRELNEVAIARLLFALMTKTDDTAFREIAWLAPGHSVTVTPDRIRFHRAWQPDSARVGRWRGSAADAASEMRSLVESAVSSRLPREGSVAAHLSGGLDSSAVAIIAARQLRTQNRRLHTYSLLARAPGSKQDERQYVDAVLAQESDLHWSPVFMPSLNQMECRDPDLPMSGAFTAPDEWICASSAAAGSEMILSGAGGDEGATYNGVEIGAAMLGDGRWRALVIELHARARRTGRPFLRVAASHLLGPWLPDFIVARRRRKLGQPLPGARLRNAASFLRPPLAERIGQVLQEPKWGSNRGDRIELLSESYLTNRANRWSIIGARHGVAFSYPLVDRRIVDFVLSLPVERFVDGGYSRQPYRNAMAGILPESIRWRDTKFPSFPDIPSNLADSMPGLAIRLETVRSTEASTAMFNMDAMAQAFSGASRYFLAQGTGHEPSGIVAGPIKLALHATRALMLSEYVARMT